MKTPRLERLRFPGWSAPLLAAAAGSAVLAFSAGIAASDEGRRLDPLCSLDSEHHRFELVKEGRCCPNRLELLIEDKASGETRSLVVETHLRKSATMRLGGAGKLLIAGRLERDGQGLAIVDLGTGALDTEIHAVTYRLSPSRERIVYTSRPSAAGGSRIEVYDLAGGAAVVAPASGSRVRSPFLWSEDEERVLYVDESDGRLSLVTVDLSSGLESPRAGRQALDATVAGRGAGVSLRWRDRETVEVGNLRDVGGPVLMPVR